MQLTNWNAARTWQPEPRTGDDHFIITEPRTERGLCSRSLAVTVVTAPRLLLAVTPDTGPRLSNMALMQLSRVTGSKQLKLMTRQLTGQQTVLSFWCWYFPRKHSAKYKISIYILVFFCISAVALSALIRVSLSTALVPSPWAEWLSLVSPVNCLRLPKRFNARAGRSF